MKRYIVILPERLPALRCNDHQELHNCYSHVPKIGATEAASAEEAAVNVFYRGFKQKGFRPVISKRIMARLRDTGQSLDSEVYLVDEVLDETGQPVRERWLREVCEEAYLASAMAERRGGNDIDYFDEARRLLKTHFRRPSEARKPAVRETLF